MSRAASSPQGSSARRQFGITLIELMIGLVIGLIIVGSVLYVFMGARRTYQYNDALARIQESGRIAIDMISQDLRMTGFIGCRRLWSYLLPAHKGSIPIQQIYFSSSFADAITQSIGSTEALDLTKKGFVFSAKVPGQLSGTDNIIGLMGRTSIPITGMANEASDLKTTVIVPEGPAVISDCRFDDLNMGGTPTNIPAPAEAFLVAESGTTIVHAEFRRVYEADASITPISVVSYSIREARIGSSGEYGATADARKDAAGDAVLSLFRSANSSGALELIEGARDLCVRYGVATNANNMAVGSYMSADDIDKNGIDWKRVISVRVEILLASIDDNVLDTPAAAPTLCDRESPDPPQLDRRMYKVFTATVGLRNQIASD